jgi:hypothetical protein
MYNTQCESNSCRCLKEIRKEISRSLKNKTDSSASKQHQITVNFSVSESGEIDADATMSAFNLSLGK